MRVSKPYFLTNPEWYIFDEKNCRYILTDKATDEAKKSFDDYYNQIDEKYMKESEDEST